MSSISSSEHNGYVNNLNDQEQKRNALYFTPTKQSSSFIPPLSASPASFVPLDNTTTKIITPISTPPPNKLITEEYLSTMKQEYESSIKKLNDLKEQWSNRKSDKPDSSKRKSKNSDKYDSSSKRKSKNKEKEKHRRSEAVVEKVSIVEIAEESDDTTTTAKENVLQMFEKELNRQTKAMMDTFENNISYKVDSVGERLNSIQERLSEFERLKNNKEGTKENNQPPDVKDVKVLNAGNNVRSQNKPENEHIDENSNLILNSGGLKSDSESIMNDLEEFGDYRSEIGFSDTSSILGQTKGRDEKDENKDSDQEGLSKEIIESVSHNRRKGSG